MFSFDDQRKATWERGFQGVKALARRLPHPSRKPRFPTRWRAAMKFKYETLLLRSLFGACVLICAMTVGSMLLA
jgi:hypothetical protein